MPQLYHNPYTPGRAGFSFAAVEKTTLRILTIGSKVHVLTSMWTIFDRKKIQDPVLNNF